MDKKIYGRVSESLPATIVNEDGVELHVIAVDTTGDGVNVLCDFYQRDAIVPGGNFLVGGRPVQLSISLTLPDGEGQDAPFRAKCHIAFLRRLSKERCMIGMRYVDVESQSLNRLVRYLKKSAGLNEAHWPI
ncbi:PilZ domain-containing protein [Candidatus Methylomicrobium oryzae]|uniref:PilZ domain-containing protein n=1 Tax=Candidatus Methylomicrobium oryzae TaxID=2802053 RepID=UPI00192176E2|nr:PilZ domain-containing protein [Methylomicrobium sp. RS1]MBL1265527.1 PilZ domain-containing protein [Methylomicrobium sp. RS1]